MASEASVIGCFLWAQNFLEQDEAAGILGAGFISGELVPVVGARYALGNAADAHAAIEERIEGRAEQGARGKVILIPTSAV